VAFVFVYGFNICYFYTILVYWYYYIKKKNNEKGLNNIYTSIDMVAEIGSEIVRHAYNKYTIDKS